MLIFDKSTTIERISSLFSIPVVVKLFGFFVLIRGTSVLYKHSYGERTSQTPLQIFLDQLALWEYTTDWESWYFDDVWALD